MLPTLARFAARGSSYYENGSYRMSPAMIRARRPYFWRNFGTFLIIASVPLGVYLYTFSFLHTDDLEDIPVPPLSDEQVQELQKEYRKEKAEQAAAESRKD
ncbi:DEKNAAC100452 [Brettanomyces naardenensis]|uniref:Cytochrome c oxidase assembly factor 3 n=1 Tax=Brettanomyces naardenensis TaxID=13370 RepID=A0A448YGW2_BRENA|nr:DEKNAAC100452 [Brettanomyces naardenensis]